VCERENLPSGMDDELDVAREVGALESGPENLIEVFESKPESPRTRET